jgi:hypothetical protein
MQGSWWEAVAIRHDCNMFYKCAGHHIKYVIVSLKWHILNVCIDDDTAGQGLIDKAFVQVVDFSPRYMTILSWTRVGAHISVWYYSTRPTLPSFFFPRTEHLTSCGCSFLLRCEINTSRIYSCVVAPDFYFKSFTIFRWCNVYFFPGTQRIYAKTVKPVSF